MEKYDVTLLKIASNSEIRSVVYADEGETSDCIILNIKIDGKDIAVESEQYLVSYQKIRDELLKIGYGLKCSGSLINANQSAMMAYTPKIYLLKMGERALLKNVVVIWDYCDINHFPTTAEQLEFTRKWEKSLCPR